METSSIRSARRRQVDWLPRPDGDLNGAPVWHETRLSGIETQRRGPGRPAKTPQK